MHSITRTRGFTLIELLVVIAIIGILAAVVLASLNSARDKGEDAATKSNLNNARAQAALYYDDHKTYVDVCTASDGIAQFLTAGGDCDSDADAWAAWAPLASSTFSYCVDSTGKATTTEEAIASGSTACPS